MCGHSLEVNATSDVTFYLSTQHICLAQTLAEENLQCLLTSKKQDLKAQSEHAHQSHPAVHFRKPVQFIVDSGIGSEESVVVDSGSVNRNQPVTIETDTPKQRQARPVMMKQKVVQRVSVLPAQNRSNKPKSRRITPSDILFTAGKINVFFYSKESPPCVANESVHQQDDTNVSLDSSIVPTGSIQPFLHLEVSQPSAIACLERHQQKIEVSIYDVSLDGVSVKNSAVGM